MTGIVAAGIVLLQGGIAGLLVVGLRRRNASIVLNAAGALAATALPASVELGLRVLAARHVALGPHLTAWIALAGFLHVLGMMGLYESTRWWDHLTHTVSASLVAAVVYAGLSTADRAVIALPSSGELVIAATVLSVFGVGVLWELIELLAREASRNLGIQSILIPYGPRDTLLDLVFDVVGALLVVAFDVRVFVPIAEQAPELVAWLLLAGAAVVLFGSIGIGGVLLLVGATFDA